MVRREQSWTRENCETTTRESRVTLIGMRVCLLALLPGLLCAQSLQDFEKKVTEFTLPNGLHFLIIERHEAPVVSFHTYVNVGSVDDPSGDTGLAHMFEHMAFKGTPTIGTKNWPAEKKALDADRGGLRSPGCRAATRASAPIPRRSRRWRRELKAAIAKADSYVEPNEYDRIVESNGGVGHECRHGRGFDRITSTAFPSNRMELWFLLESERFLHPVFREFYKERDVVREERRMRVESSPQGKLMEALAGDGVRGASLSRTCRAAGPAISRISAAPDAERFTRNITRRRTSPSASRAT